MNDRTTELLSSKTFWASLSTIFGSVAAAATGTLPWGMAIQPIVTGLIGMCLRDTLAKQNSSNGKDNSSLTP